MRFIKIVLLAVMCFLMISNSVAVEQQNKAAYKFGVFPYLSAVRLDNIYAPVSDELSQVIAHKVKFRTSSTFKKFLKKLKSGYYDFALIQPFWYPVAVDEVGYIPLLKMEEPFVSLIMVLDDSPIKKLSDLKGEVIATPPAFVPVVHMARRALIEKGMQPGIDVEFKAYKTVDSCFQQLLIGNASACVAPPFAPVVFEEAMNVKFRVLLKSKAIPNLALVIHSRLNSSDRMKIRNTIMSWSDTSKGKKLLSDMQTERFLPIDDKDYDVVRKFLKEIEK